MAKPRKGVVPPQLRAYLFKKGRKPAKRAAAATAVRPTARRGRGRGKGRRVGRARLPLVPVIVATIPEIIVGAKAAQEIKLGTDAVTVGQNVLGRLGQLYGGRVVDEATLKTGENIAMKVAGAAIHLVMRKMGMTIPLGRRLTLF